MKGYVFTYVGDITRNWHSGGGALVITDGDPRAVLNAHVNAHEDADYYDSPLVPDFDDATEPVAFETDATEERVFIFPDSGCC